MTRPLSFYARYMSKLGVKAIIALRMEVSVKMVANFSLR